MQFGLVIHRHVFTLVDSFCDLEAVLRLVRGAQRRKTRRGDESRAVQRWISHCSDEERCI